MSNEYVPPFRKNKTLIANIPVKEYVEEMNVDIDVIHEEGQTHLVLTAENEGGYNCTQVDLLQLVSWVRDNQDKICELSNEFIMNDEWIHNKD